MKNIYIINDLMQTYYWNYELDKINPSKSDLTIYQNKHRKINKNY